MSANNCKQYKWHVRNLQEIQLAIDITARAARLAICQKNRDNNLQSLIRLYLFLIGAWAECRLKKLLYETSGFNDQERNMIMFKGEKKKRSQLMQWEEAIKLAFKKHYKLTRAKLNRNNLGATACAQKDALLDMLKYDLKIIIEIRNKLAHGQWIYPLTESGNKVDNNTYQLINQENLLSLQFKYSLINQLANVIHDLIVSPSTFKRDFDMHFKKIDQQKENLKNRKYAKYEKNLINSYQKKDKI